MADVHRLRVGAAVLAAGHAMYTIILQTQPVYSRETSEGHRSG